MKSLTGDWFHTLRTALHDLASLQCSDQTSSGAPNRSGRHAALSIVSVSLADCGSEFPGRNPFDYDVLESASQ
jgi:hypothetical protein